jgi:hypothetical protein
MLCFWVQTPLIIVATRHVCHCISDFAKMDFQASPRGGAEVDFEALRSIKGGNIVELSSLAGTVATTNIKILEQPPRHHIGCIETSKFVWSMWEKKKKNCDLDNEVRRIWQQRVCTERTSRHYIICIKTWKLVVIWSLRLYGDVDMKHAIDSGKISMD